MPVPAHVAARVKPDRALIRQAFVLRGDDPEFNDVPDSEIDPALATVDATALYEEFRSSTTSQVWDRKSPINGVSAAEILSSRSDIPESGDIYLILQDGVIVGFQPHDPDVPGVVPIPKGQGRQRGERHADQISADRANAEVVNRVRKHIIDTRSASADTTA